MKRSLFSSIVLLLSFCGASSAAADGQVPSFAVSFPPGREAVPPRLGPLAASDAQLPDDKDRTQASSRSQAPADSSPQRHPFSADFDGFAGVTFGLPGARAFAGPVDSQERTTLPMLGFALNKFFGDRKFAGVFADFSFVDPGSAFAQLGSFRSEVQGWVVDFHGGYQYQYPGRRVRPYVQGGLGVFMQHTSAAFTSAGTTLGSVDQIDSKLSFIFGGGARFMIGDDWGVRAGLDAVSVRVDEGGYLNYGRFVGATFFSF